MRIKGSHAKVLLEFLSKFIIQAGIEITLAERGEPGATIQGVGDGLWWAITTLTTVGYGDIYPSTTEGRFIAVGLMVSGICVLGVISATVAAWFVKMTQDDSTSR